MAEKFDDLSWSRLSPPEKKRVRKFGLEVCSHLAETKARELAKILDLELPPDFRPATDAEILRRGKNALMAKVRATCRAHGVRHTENPANPQD